MPDVFLGVFNTDIGAPVLLNPAPAPMAVGVPLDSAIEFDIRDSDTGASGVDLDSVMVTVNGIVIHENGITASGWSVIITPLTPAGDWSFSFTRTGGLERDAVVNVAVNASDLAAIPNVMDTYTWQFATTPGVIETPRLFASGRDGAVDVVWQVNPEMLVVRYELRRSTVAAPTMPTEGELVFTGNVQVYADGDVVNGTRYFYTIFVVRNLAGGVTPVYVDYEDVASASAVPRAIVVPVVKLNEYVPVRGEFGAVVSYPLAAGSSSVWGDLNGAGRQERDLIIAALGAGVRSPVTGRVHEISTGDQGLRVVLVDSDVGGFRFRIAQIKPSPMLAVGARVRAGEVLGRLGSQPLEFSIVKLPTGRYGERTVRPAYFYLTLEARDGRR